jgi:hypothetical protein
MHGLSSLDAYVGEPAQRMRHKARSMLRPGVRELHHKSVKRVNECASEALTNSQVMFENQRRNDF